MEDKMLISIRAPARGATVLSKRRNSAENNFNPRSREGSDWKALRSTRCLDIFQSALPRGERRVDRFKNATYVTFQSALPRGERLRLLYAVLSAWDFNPRSREGSDRQSPVHRSLLPYFNPRSREGSDKEGKYKGTTKEISIRAPARGATMSVNDIIFASLDFNPRSREGSDHHSRIQWLQQIQFQSALPRGERPGARTLDTLIKNFNPRSREGSDGINTNRLLFSLISIRAPARGATGSTQTGFCFP